MTDELFRVFEHYVSKIVRDSALDADTLDSAALTSARESFAALAASVFSQTSLRAADVAARGRRVSVASQSRLVARLHSEQNARDTAICDAADAAADAVREHASASIDADHLARFVKNRVLTLIKQERAC